VKQLPDGLNRGIPAGIEIKRAPSGRDERINLEFPVAGHFSTRRGAFLIGPRSRLVSDGMRQECLTRLAGSGGES
jgi:hypothetical protein